MSDTDNPKKKPEGKEVAEKYDWGKEFDAIERDLSNYFFSSLINFLEKHLSLIPVSPSKEDRKFRDYVKELWDGHVGFYLTGESNKYLDPAVRIEKNSKGALSYCYYRKGIDEIVKSRKLNSEEEKDLIKLIGQKYELFRKYFIEMSKARWDFYCYGRSNKLFWMERNFRKFIRLIREGMERQVDKDAKSNEDMRRLIGDISDVEQKEIDEWKRAMKAHIGEVFAEFEGDLRKVQEALQRHWWEGEEIEFLAKGAVLLSATASVITIVNGFGKEWVKWFVSVVAILATGYFGYLIYKWVKGLLR